MKLDSERANNVVHITIQVAIFFGYLVFGALVFQSLEVENERRERANFASTKTRLKLKYNVSEKDLNEFILMVQSLSDQGFSNEWAERWNFIGALFFSGTVVTTIGYGHLAPVTSGGRLFCIFYAFIGIPLTWMMLARLGCLISDFVSHTISTIERRFLHREATRLGLKSTVVTFMMAMGMIILIATIARFTEQWPFIDGIYFGFVTLSTIGFGDLVPLHPYPGQESSEYATHVTLFTVLTLLYFTIGLAVVSSVMLSISCAMDDPSLLGFNRVATESDTDLKEKEFK